MPDTRVASRYAEAMIEVAAEADAVDAVGADLSAFNELLDANEGQLRSVLCTPLFSGDERSAVLNDLLPKLGMNPLSCNLLRLANDKGRLDIVGQIASAYSKLADERAGRVAVHVTTAVPITDAIAEEIKSAMAKSTGKDVVLHTDVDPELIGGMVARVGGKLYDSSIRTRLEALKRALVRAGPVGEA